MEINWDKGIEQGLFATFVFQYFLNTDHIVTVDAVKIVDRSNENDTPRLLGNAGESPRHNEKKGKKKRRANQP